MSSFKETCIWMSYRYAIGRKTIASHAHAADISKHMDWIPQDRWNFTACDIFTTINDSVSFTNNIKISISGRGNIDVYSVIFEFLSENKQFLNIDEFNKYDWDVNLVTRVVTPKLRATPYAYGSFLQDYSDYVDWIRLANLFLNKSKRVIVEFGGKTSSYVCQEVWNLDIKSDDICLAKRYYQGHTIEMWHVTPECIKEIKDYE